MWLVILGSYIIAGSLFALFIGDVISEEAGDDDRLLFWLIVSIIVLWPAVLVAMILGRLRDR